MQNLLDKKKEVFVNKEYVRPFNHRTAPQQYGGLRLYPGCYPGLGASAPSGRVGGYSSGQIVLYIGQTSIWGTGVNFAN